MHITAFIEQEFEMQECSVRQNENFLKSINYQVLCFDSKQKTQKLTKLVCCDISDDVVLDQVE